MVQSPSWETNWFAASQEIPRISRNPKVHYRTHKRPPTVSILGQPNLVHIHTSHLLEIHPNIIHPSTPRSPQWAPSLRFPHQHPIHTLSSPIPATCPAHLILLDFITRTILGEQYKSFSSSLCNLLNSPVTSSLLGPNILLNTMFCSQTPSAFFPPAVSTTKFHTYTKQQAKSVLPPVNRTNTRPYKWDFLMAVFYSKRQSVFVLLCIRCGLYWLAVVERQLSVSRLLFRFATNAFGHLCWPHRPRLLQRQVMFVTCLLVSYFWILLLVSHWWRRRREQESRDAFVQKHNNNSD